MSKLAVSVCFAVGVIALAAAQSPAALNCAGPIGVTINGGYQTWQVATFSWAGTKANTQSVTLQHNDRAYLVASCYGDTFSPSLYDTKFQVLGKTVNYTVSLSAAGCACNAAFYMVSMPAVGSAGGQPDPTESGDYYCDANAVSGVWCPEMDIMEANTAALAATPHDCDSPSSGYYPHCDQGGCSVNTKNGPGGQYGGGGSFKIDTTQPFTVSTQFGVDGSQQLSSVTTTLSQGNQNVVLVHTDSQCGGGYLERLTGALAAGMVPTLSLWGDAAGSMSWLDQPPCGGESCDPSSTATFYNIMIY